MLDLSPAQQAILAAIEAGREPWSDVVAVLLLVAEEHGPFDAMIALAGLVADEWVERWEATYQRIDEQLSKKAGRPVWVSVDIDEITLTPWGASERGVIIIESETGESVRWGEPIREPSCYRLPIGDRLPSLDDPRLGWVKDSLEAPDDREPEVLMDLVSGEAVKMWGATVAIDQRIKGKTG